MVEQSLETITTVNEIAKGIVVKVSATSRPSAVAGAIAGIIREQGTAQVQAIGAGAVNQAVKAIAIARIYLLKENVGSRCIPFFVELVIDGNERTAIQFVVESIVQ